MNRNEEFRKKALATAMSQVEKAYGPGTAMRMDAGVIEDVPVTSTGSIKLDAALGIGGYPSSRIIEISGPEAGGKTTLALHAIAEQQKAGGTCVFIDAEHALDPAYAEALGVNVSELILSQPNCGEQALEVADTFIRSGAVDMVVVDSVAALTPKAELEGEMGDSVVGLHARLMSRAMRKLTGTISDTGCKVIFINQIRHKIGVTYGSPETTTGGLALKFYSSVRLDVRKCGNLKKGDSQYGNEIRIKVVKNKMAPPFKNVTTELVFGEGISRLGEIIDLGVEFGIIKKKGAWYSYEGDQIGQGKDNVRSFLADNPDVAEEIEGLVRERLSPDDGSSAPGKKSLREKPERPDKDQLH